MKSILIHILGYIFPYYHLFEKKENLISEDLDVPNGDKLKHLAACNRSRQGVIEYNHRMTLLLGGSDDAGEISWFQRSTTDQSAVDIRLCQQAGCIAGIHAATI